MALPQLPLPMMQTLSISPLVCGLVLSDEHLLGVHPERFSFGLLIAERIEADFAEISKDDEIFEPISAARKNQEQCHR